MFYSSILRTGNFSPIGRFANSLQSKHGDHAMLSCLWESLIHSTLFCRFYCIRSNISSSHCTQIVFCVIFHRFSRHRSKPFFVLYPCFRFCNLWWAARVSIEFPLIWLFNFRISSISDYNLITTLQVSHSKGVFGNRSNITLTLGSYSGDVNICEIALLCSFAKRNRIRLLLQKSYWLFDGWSWLEIL